jgi:hypothetical protein
MTGVQQTTSGLVDVRDEGFTPYYDFARNHYCFLSRCLVANGHIDFDVNTEYTLDEWHNDYKIVQFWDHKEIPDDVCKLIEAWRNSVPYGCHVVFNDEEARNFIKQHYPSTFVDAYDRCWHPAMKSDYFRLTYLYVNGGLYIDADERMLHKAPNIDFSGASFLGVFPLMRERNEQGDFVRVTVGDLASRPVAVSGPECYFNNSPIFATRRNHALKIALNSATRLIQKAREDHTTPNIHATTGPTNWTLAIAAHLIHSACTGRQPSEIKVIEWTRYASTMPLEYKDGDRNWRNALPAG